MKTNTKLRALLTSRFGGLLHSGSHQPNGKACALEFVSQYKGISWTDNPLLTLGIDIRPLNDALWSTNTARTQAMLPVIEALIDYPDWSASRKRLFADYLAIHVVRDILGDLFEDLGNFEQSKQCKNVRSLSAAVSAARSAAGYAAGYAAGSAASAAAYAAYAGSAAGAARSAAGAARSAAASAVSAARSAAYAARSAAGYAAASAAAYAGSAAGYAVGSAAYAARSAAASAVGSAAYAARSAAASAAGYAAEYAAESDKYLKMICEIFIRACMASASDVE